MQSARARVAVAANDYVGVLRRRVASKMATPASQVRLLFSGVRPPLMKPLCLMRLHTCLCYSRSPAGSTPLASQHHTTLHSCIRASCVGRSLFTCMYKPQQHLFGKRGLRRCGCAGQELKSDSRLVRDVGLTEGHSIHAIITPNANAYTEPGQLQAAQDEAASPRNLARPTGALAQHLCLFAMFTHCNTHVCHRQRAAAYQRSVTHQHRTFA